MAPHTDDDLWSHYEDLGLIGWGACCKVKLACHRLTGIRVAIKILEKEDEKFFGIASEVEMLKSLQHPNVVSLLQVMETKTRTYLVLELGQRTLLQHIHRTRVLPEDEARRLFKQVLQALHYCHERGVAHRDIKADNIMLDRTGKVIVIDFGLAATFEPGQMLTRFCGAYKYLSPEVFQHQPYDGTKKDMWAAGVLLYTMVTGTLPFQYTALWELKQHIVEGAYDMPSNLSPDLQDVISLLLEVDPEERPTAEEILEHPWFQQGDGGSSHLQGTLPTALDSRILSAMNLIGFDIEDTRQSILLRTFDHRMATYSLYLRQARREKGGFQAPDHPGTTPFPTPTHPSAFCLPPKRRYCEPPPGCFSPSFPNKEQPEEGEAQILSRCRCDSLPIIPISQHLKRPTVIPVPKPPHCMSAPAILCIPNRPEAQLTQEQPAASICETQSPSQTQELPEQMAAWEITSEEEREASSPSQPRGWRAWPRRITRCIRRLFSRRPVQGSSHPFRNRVAPIQAKESSDHHQESGNLEESTLCVPCGRGRKAKKDKTRPS